MPHQMRQLCSGIVHVGRVAAARRPIKHDGNAAGVAERHRPVATAPTAYDDIRSECL